MARLSLGLPALRGKLKNYSTRFGMLEVTLHGPGPKASTLRRWRREVPPDFAFSVVLPRVVSTFAKGPDFDKALEITLETARVLQASCIVLATPPSVRPTKANRTKIASLAALLPKDGQVLAWEPSGMWEPEDVMVTAYEAGWLPIFDAAQQPLPPGATSYTRIRAMGHAAQLGPERIEHIAEQLRGRRDSYVVVDQEIAGNVRAGLATALAQDPAVRNVPLLFKPEANLGDDGEE